MRNPLYILIATVILWVAVASCGGSSRSYSRWAQLPDGKWAYGDTLKLVPVDTSLTDNDTIVTGPLRLGIGHSNEYPYSNLWLEVTYRGAHGAYRDTVNVRLADVYGRWVGSGFGASYQHEILLSPQADVDLRLPVGVRHIMRVDTLKGIDLIGIFVR